MAERAGFEPAVEFDPYDGLANRSFRPLRHLSAKNVFLMYGTGLYFIFRDFQVCFKIFFKIFLFVPCKTKRNP